MLALPVAHIMGFMATLGMACAGLPVYFIPKFRPTDVLDAIESRHASIFIGVPAMYRMLLEAGAEERDLSSVRLWGSGADAMPSELAAKFKKMGATFTLPFVGPVGEARSSRATAWSRSAAVPPPRSHRPASTSASASRSASRCPATSSASSTTTARTCAPGRWASCCIKGPGCSKGYWGDAAATAATFTDDGWLRTGDLARKGALGMVLFAGRKKDVIKHGGYSVYAVEVEQALEEHPDVLEAAVVGLPDERKGEIPAAVVRLVDGATLDEDALRTWAADKLADYKVPQRFVAVDDLPRTGTRKVQKTESQNVIRSTSPHSAP